MAVYKLSNGPVVRRTTYNPNAPWRKHGTWRVERPAPGMCALPRNPNPVATYIVLRRVDGTRMTLSARR